MKRRIFYLFSVVFLSFYGCGGPVIVIPNYNNAEFSKKLDSLKNSPRVIKVVDKRGAKSTYAGTAQVGLFNALEPYYLDEPVSMFVESAVNKMISNNELNSKYVPVNIAVEQFKVYERESSFSEKGYFDCKLKFRYNLTRDSVVSIVTVGHQVTSGLDVTNSLEGLIYKGVSDCTQQFCKFFKNNIPIDSLKEGMPVEIITSDDTNNTKISYVPETLKQKDRISTNYFGIEYIQGNKIPSGVNILYQQFYNLSGQQLAGGFGMSFSYYNVSNSNLYMDGAFLGITARYSLRYFWTNAKSGFYFAFGLRLIGGNEKIDYGNGNSQTNYFFGPTIEESVGFSISKKFMIEAGLYEIKLWGSQLLPDDIGIAAGINFGI